MSTETIISTIRHAETAYNGQKRYAGSLDIPLNENGISQARRAADRLNKADYDLVLTSKLKRAYDTAKILLGDAVPILQTKLCNERNFGIMEGLSWEEVKKLEPPVLMIEVGNDLHTVNPQRGEPFEKVWQRAITFRRLIFRKYKGRRILVVSHGVCRQFFHGLLRGLTCIESLAKYPSNLELATFRFIGEELVEENVSKLTEANPVKW